MIVLKAIKIMQCPCIISGKYYGSLFVHYQPVDKSLWDVKDVDVTYNVPPHWNDGTTEQYGSRWAGNMPP